MKLINKILVLSLLVGVSACRDTPPKAEVEQSSSEKLTNVVDVNVKEKVTKETKKIVKPQYHVDFQGYSYPVYTRRINAPEEASENEVKIHEIKESIRLIYAEARAASMTNINNYKSMIRGRSGELGKLRAELDKLKVDTDKFDRRGIKFDTKRIKK